MDTSKQETKKIAAQSSVSAALWRAGGLGSAADSAEIGSRRPVLEHLAVVPHHPLSDKAIRFDALRR
jgi:hypothetical protein